MIIDTDVMIWALRGAPKAVKAVQAALPFNISSVTYMELLQGMRDKREMNTLSKQIRQLGINIIQIDEAVSSRACGYVKEFCLSHSLEMADALVAATAIEHNEQLFTGNAKHYQFIPNLKLRVYSN